MSVDFTGAVIFRYHPLTFIEMYDDFVDDHDDADEDITFVNFLRRNLTDSDKTRRFVCVFKVNRSGNEIISLEVVNDTDVSNVPDDALEGLIGLLDRKSKKVDESPFACFLTPSVDVFEHADYWIGPRFDAKVLWEHFVDVYGINLEEETARQLQAKSLSQNLASLSASPAILDYSPARLPQSMRQQSSVPKSKAAQLQAKRSKNRVCMSPSPAISVDSDSPASLPQSMRQQSSSDTCQNLLYPIGMPEPLLKVVLLNGHYTLYPVTTKGPNLFGFDFNSHWQFHLDCDRIEETRGGGNIVDSVAFMTVRIQISNPYSNNGLKSYLKSYLL